MTRRLDPERLVLEDLTDDERRALLAEVDAADAAAVGRLADAFSALEAEDWHAATTPALRFVPEGAGEPVPLWSRVCVRGDAGEHRIAAPFVAAALTVALVLAFAAGFVLRGGTDDGPPSDGARADAGLERAPAVPLVRMASAPSAAGGVARMVPGRDGRVMLRAHGLAPTGKGRWYELWMMRDERHAVSVGTFRVRADGTVQARFRVTPAASRYPTMDVTVQSATDGRAHSGRSVLRSPPA
ncbi:anti-sigma factor [Patulibacter minatonensis]|uniref:anti-sigma factor n=1 Tax=Patulibacter minatonensis TaxID=298163 RepID=UPI0004786BC9|nr:anti-sigma factor [Patulibacter minatonensis]